MEGVGGRGLPGGDFTVKLPRRRRTSLAVEGVRAFQAEGLAGSKAQK